MACDLNSITRQVLAKWRASHGGAIPKTSADKDAMRDMIEDMQVAETKDEENFVEAKQLARHAYSPFEIPSEVKAILSDPKVHDDSTCHEPFWYLILKKWWQGSRRPGKQYHHHICNSLTCFVLQAHHEGPEALC